MSFESLKEKALRVCGAVKRFFIRFSLAAWAYIKKAKVELIVIAAVLIFDQVTKVIIDATMEVDQTIVLIPNLLQFWYTRNDGAAFGSKFGLDKLFGDRGAMGVLITITFIAVGGFSYFMYRNRGGKKLCVIPYALIIGGAVGNLIDRIAFGAVRDFVQFVYFGKEFFGQKTFASFNVADASLVIGVILFAVYYIFIYRDPKEQAKKKAAAAAGGDTVLYEEEEPEADTEEYVTLTEPVSLATTEEGDKTDTGDRDE